LLFASSPNAVTYTWRLNSVVMQSSSSNVYSANTVGNYDCIAVNACGSSNSNVITVVSGAPVGSISSVPSSGAICTGGSVLLSASTATGQTYQWRMNNTSIGGATTSTFNATVSAVYDCVISNSCGSTISSSISVWNYPSPVITALGPTLFCPGGSVTLHSNTVSNFANWSLNGTAIAGTTASTYIATSTGQYTYSTYGTCTVTSNIITVTVESTPAANISAGGSTTICSGGLVTLSANTGTGISYQWLLNGANISGATASTYAAVSAGAYTCFESNSCGSSTSNTISVTVSSPPIATITSAGPTVFCSGGSVVLNANTGIGLSYQWKMNGVNISGATASFFAAGAAGTYSCVVTNSCGNSTSNSVTVIVNAAPPAPTGITGQTSGVCSSTKIYSVSPVSGATSYLWAAPAGSLISAGQGTNSVNITFTSSYSTGTLSVQAVNTCGNSTASSSVITGAPAQPAAISGPVSVCHNQNNVIYSIVAVAGATSYTWTVPSGTNIKSGQGTLQIKVRFGNSGGTITVKANNNCGSGSSRSLAVAMPCRDTESTEEIVENALKLTAYPNPARDLLNVAFTNPSASEVILQVYDLTGRIVAEHGLFSQQGENIVNLDFSSLGKGCYLLCVYSNHLRQYIKVVKE
jgi:hypothetical protein